MSTSLPLSVADLVCVEDLDPFAAETTSDLQTLEQDVFHILIEDPGSNPDDPDRGIGIDALLSGTTVHLAALPDLIDHELQKDDRVDSSRLTLTQLSDGSFRIEIEIQVDATVIPLAFTYSSVGGLQRAF